MDDNTLGMMGKMNIKLPTPTQSERKKPQFNEWAGEVKAYLTIHNVHFEDYMGNCTSSIDVVHISDIQNDYTANDYVKLNNKLPAVPAEDTDEYEEYTEMTMNIRKKNDIASCSQTWNYVFVHSTKPGKPGGEAHSIVKRIMRQSSEFKVWRQLTLHYAGAHRAQHFSLLRNNNATQLRLHNQITHSTILQVDGSQRANCTALILRANNATTFTEVHKWIINFFNGTCTGTDDDNAAIGAVTDATEETNKYNVILSRW
eukprot:1566788-Amphidinium_carterae.1